MSQPQAHQPNIKLYLMVFGALMVLTVVTVLVSYLHLPKTLGIFVGLLIATVKVALVAAFFMHLKGERTLIYSLLGVTFFFVIALYALPLIDFVLLEDQMVHASTVQNPQDEHGH